MRNVEIKAKVSNLKNLLEKAKNLAGNDGTILKQHDSFYNIPNGRLKLRRFPQAGNGELIFYDRPDTEGPKISTYEKSNVGSDNVEGLHNVLLKALGPKNDVKKVRHLFLVEQTRVHIDSVEKLGDFMELEVVLNDDQTPEEGEKIALDLMQKLGVNEENLISGAYADLLTK